MKTKKRTTAVAGVVVVVLAALAGAVYGADSLLDHKKTEQFTVSQPLHQLIVSADAGDVHVFATDTDRVTVQQITRWVISEPSPKRTVADRVLRLENACSGGWFVFHCETNYRIEVPRELAVVISTDAGDVRVSGLAGSVSLKTDAGDIHGTDLGAAKVKATADAGDVRLAFATAPASIEARTDAGDVDIELPSAEYAVDAGTNAGDTSVTGIVRYDLAPRAVSAHADAGDVTIRGH